MGRVESRRRPRLSSVLVLAGVFLAATPGWVLGPRLPAAGDAAPARRSDWQPSPMAKHWEAPVLPAAGGAQGRSAPHAPAPPPASAPRPAAGRGEWHEEHLESRVLGRRMPYLIWAPPGYTPSRRYPVVYLLHGAGDGQAPGRAEWMNLGIREAIERATAAGELPPALFVFPEGLQGYWIDHAGGGPRWATYVIEDVVPHVDRVWATDARPERRAIGGLSMGGHGALHLALNHPDVFRIAGAHSPALRSHAESPPFFGDGAWFARFDPLTLAALRAPGGPTARLTVWLDTGESDRWRGETERVAAALRQGGAKADLRLFKGRHEGAYWRAHLGEYLRFYAAALGAR